VTRGITKQKPKSIASYTVFFGSLAVAIPIILSFLFPALIVSLTTSTPDETVKQFELGVLFFPFFAASLLVLGIYLMYTSENLPSLVQRSIKFIFKFEVSQKISLLVILILLVVYVSLSFHELYEPEEWPDFNNVLISIEGWPFENVNAIQHLIFM